MDRRTFLETLTGSLLAAPLAAEAQRAGRRVPLVGVLWQGEPSASVVLRAEEAFRQGLREHGGYVEGQNIAIESRYADLDGLSSAANDLVRLNVDVIVAGGVRQPPLLPSGRPLRFQSSRRVWLILLPTG